MNAVLHAAVMFGCLLSTALAGGPSFWVWNRSASLAESEKRDLRSAGASTLYWHFAEIENHSGQWEWKRRLPRLPEKTSASNWRVVPVVRLESSVSDPFPATERKNLAEKIASALRALDAEEWQIDYDAPDRLVGDYAVLLAELRPLAPRLSSTALADWVRLPAFPKLCRSVDALFPMFYDLHPDTLQKLASLVDEKEMRVLMNEWEKHCTVKWQAGLPWFARLTLYGADGHSRGHFRHWTWDEVVFRRELKFVEPWRDDMLVLRADKAFELERSAIHAGDCLVARWPSLVSGFFQDQFAKEGAVFFRLPDGAASSGWSLPQFSQRGKTGEAKLFLRLVNESLVLSNEGKLDLPLRVRGDGPLDRGYAVEVEAGGPVFREAEAGEFYRVAGHTEPDSENPRRVPLSTATRLTFWFSALPAGAVLKSGLFQFAPHAEISPARYRIVNLEEHPSWKPLEIAR
ncbi:MAG TPA: hypothetical protein VGH65_00950 [Verrucomicrobiaceae bacterium]